MIGNRAHVFGAALVGAALLAGCDDDGGGGAGTTGNAPTQAATVSVLSSRADAVSGGDALVQITVPTTVAASNVRVTVAGQDQSAAFRPAGDGRLVGLVSGMAEGSNRIEVSGVGGVNLSGSLSVRNYGRNGPIFSGPQQTPFICQTADFVLPDGSRLGAPQDAACNAPTKITYVYRARGGTTFIPLPSTTAVPADAATTVTSDGRTVNYIVRVETGTLNRSIYQFATLYDPTAESAPGPLAIYRGWNRKVIFTFGGSISAGYVQGVATGGVLDDTMLSKGYSVISSTLNVLGNVGNDVVAAETASMVKEKFIETFGVPIYTMGWGASGGAIQQHLIANNYPGILDAITPQLTFPDVVTTAAHSSDCSLLTRAFNASTAAFTDAQKSAVVGYASYANCASPFTTSWENTYTPQLIQAKRSNRPLFFGFTDLNNCLIPVPTSLTYDPVTNPRGARCSIYDANRNQLGVDASGAALRPLDNVGVQYGLAAFRSGAISAEQFVQVNERVGGYDNDGNLQPGRTVASDVALRNIYEFGRLNQMRNLGSIPIIDWRTYSDRNGDLHDAVRSLVVRARLVKANGTSDNQIILRAAVAVAGLDAEVLAKMDQWLMSIIGDGRTYASAGARVAANKPADLVDACYDTSGRKIAERADIANGGQCGALVPFNSDPRLVAGSPLTTDVAKCQLRALVRADYAALSNEQFARLQAVFPTGVCDYSLPSVGFAPLRNPWLSYPSPGTATPLS